MSARMKERRPAPSRGPAGRARRRLRVAVVFGGRSVEHDVSLVSARAIMAALDPRRYDVVPIAIARDGRWERTGTSALLRSNPELAAMLGTRVSGSGRPVDVVFPIVHGTGGEDGALQGLLTLAGVPFVGSGVLGSALGMDKAAMKVVFQEAGLPIGRYMVLARAAWDAAPGDVEARAVAHCGMPVFVKPANGGSSVGVSKVKDAAALGAALRLAFRYDRKVLVETAIDAREIECSVLGNDDPEVSVAGEIVPAHEFYDYDAKYHDSGSKLIIPAPLSASQSEILRDIARRAFQALDLAGMARVDCFLDRRTGVLFLNEVNTLPGFTPISMYPKLWEASGLAFPRLVDRLVRLAFERHARQGRLETAFRRGRG